MEADPQSLGSGERPDECRCPWCGLLLFKVHWGEAEGTSPHVQMRCRRCKSTVNASGVEGVSFELPDSEQPRAHRRS